MRELFWKEGSPFPEPVWRASLAIGAVSIVAVLWATANQRSDVLPDLLLVPVVAVVLYRLTWARYAPALLAGNRAGDFSRTAIVGLSLRHGPLLAAYGVFTWLAVLIFANLPTLFLGVPEYAYSMESAFAVVGLAPLREEVLMAALWSFVYCAAPRGKFWVATLVATAVFVGLHGQTYSGASEFAFVQLGFMRVAFSVANWLPTLRGHQPSMVPAWIGHTIQNGLWYWLTCVGGSGQSALATRLC